MNALKKPTIDFAPAPKRRVVVPLNRRPSKRRSYRTVAVETTAKLIVNGVLSAAAIAALGNLFPSYWSQQAKLQELNGKVRDAQVKVDHLRDNVSRSFDPNQAQNVMQEQSTMLAPNQRRVVLLSSPTGR